MNRLINNDHSTPKLNSYRFQAGFSLLEIAIAALVLGLVLAAVPQVWKFSLDTKGVMNQKLLMAQVNEGFEVFLQVNGYLPCPDTDGDGREDRVDASGIQVCARRWGGLPYTDLALPAMDAWGNPWYYQVHQRSEDATYINRVCEDASVFAQNGNEDLTGFWLCPDTGTFYCRDVTASASADAACLSDYVQLSPSPIGYQDAPPYYHLATLPTGTLDSNYDIDIKDASGAEISDGIVAVVVSWGLNGDANNPYASDHNDVCNSTGLTASETENCNGDRYFIYAHDSENKDYLSWIDINQAKWALMHSGKFR